MEAVVEMNQKFLCEPCGKQYVSIMQYQVCIFSSTQACLRVLLCTGFDWYALDFVFSKLKEHLQSYDHHHTVRLKEMKARERNRVNEAKRAKERAREEKARKVRFSSPSLVERPRSSSCPYVNVFVM